MSNTLVSRAIGFSLSQFTDLASSQTVSNKTLENASLTSPTITGTATCATMNASTINASTFTGALTGTVTDISNHDTDALSEGSSNLYFLNSRARGAVSVTTKTATTTGGLTYDNSTGVFEFTPTNSKGNISVVDSGGDGSLAYNSGSGVITYTGPSAAETRAHFSGGTGVDITDGVVSIGQSVATTADVQFGSVDTDSIAADNINGVVTRSVAALQYYKTDDLDEGTSNLYYTDARARGSVNVTDTGGDGSLAYNNSTGVITYTGPSAAETRAHFSGGTGVDITDGAVSIGQSVGTTDNVTFTSVTANVTGNVSGTVSDISNHKTDDLDEGTSNLYYTDNTRARAAVSVTDAGGDGSLVYNSVPVLLPTLVLALPETRLHFSGGTGVDITDGVVSIGQSVGATDNVTFNNVSVEGTLTTDDVSYIIINNS